MARIEKQVTLVGEYGFTRRAFGGYHDEYVSIYKFTDEDGKVYVWKTTGHLMKETVMGNPEDEYREVDTYFPKKGDVIIIRATVKGETKYKGEAQIELNRVVVKKVVSKYVKVKAEQQKQSVDLEAGDEIIEMPYRQYKDHYADCEAVAGSYDDVLRTIKVIVRAGRMKASGVRGKHYKYFTITNGARDEEYELKAMSLELAEKQLKAWKKKYGDDWHFGEKEKPKNANGERLYPVCDWERNQHKVYNAHDRAMVYLAESGHSAEAYEEVEKTEQAMWAFDSHVINGTVYATWEDSQLIKDYIYGYDARH